MTDVPATEPIPERPSWPLVGHAFDLLTSTDVMLYLMSEARELGPIYKLRVFDQEINLVSGLSLVEELSDETRFHKHLPAELLALREVSGDGLFTAYSDEPNWHKAHNVLMPAFSLGAMRGYHSKMLDVARTLIGKWDQASGTDAVDVTGDMPRLTFDTIGLCGFGYDFESFARTEPHPFVVAMTRTMDFLRTKAGGLPWTPLLQWPKIGRHRADVDCMQDLVDDVIRRRKASGDTSTADLLGRMLHTPDERTGEVLDDVNTRRQAITFIVAGHETTSGALSFALYYLAKHPEVLARAQAEVDALWGDTENPEPEYGDIGKLSYLRQVLNESLRLWPTAFGYAVEALEDTVIGGKYAVRKGEGLQVLAPTLHRDPAWGDNVELFDPERFSPEREETRPLHLFKPFGSGERACIGRQFALHEAMLVLALLVHRYRLNDHTNYQLKITPALTLKPENFTLRLARRTSAERRRPATTVSIDRTTAVGATTVSRAAGTALTLLHGSNLGTCTGIAGDLATDGEARGFATTLAPLNDMAGKLSADGGPVVIVAASYNGRPTDDAARFLAWTEELEPGSLEGMPYAVLGVGDRNWAATYQRVPTLIDERLAAAGATRLLERRAADAAGDFAGTVDRWTTDLWTVLLERYGTASAPATAEEDSGAGIYELEDASESVTGELAARHGVRPMRVLEAYELVDLEHPLGRSKRFLRVRLPEGVTYRTGDHFAVLPQNPDDLVRRVAARFGLDLDRTVRVKSRRRGRSSLPVDRPLTLRRLLTDFVELQDAATPEQIAALAEHTACPPERTPLAATEAGHHSVLDLLERYRACELPFERYLEMLPVMRARHYSISSSAQASPGGVDLMVSLLSAPHRAGDDTFHGIASHYLQTVGAGDVIQARVLAAGDSFRLPLDPEVPVILVSAGTGVAPFRGSVLDRIHTGERGPLLSYFGCDHPDVDYLHRDEMEAAQDAGVVSMRPAFSRVPENGVTFVQDRIAAEGEEVWDLLERGGRVYVCGDGRAMAPAVREAFMTLYRKQTGGDERQAALWLAGLQVSDRYVEDVWAG